MNILNTLRKIKNKAYKAATSEMKFPTYPKKITSEIIYADYFRYATLALAVQRIKNENISGSFAEAGVYKGHMSRFIHHLSPPTKYFLFDTFSGFPTDDLENKNDSRFQDTSADSVLAHIGNTENIIIKEGYIPDTLNGLENEIFSFVLLDLDLYNPTVSSLEFFYPRLTKGGYLIVHDYNNPESNWACKRAVDNFMQDKPENIIEIADVWGSVMIRKNS